jgi:N-acetylneuraminic acid mutarotase
MMNSEYRPVGLVLFLAMLLALPFGAGAQKSRLRPHRNFHSDGSASNEWTWMGGSSMLNSQFNGPSGIYGDLGVPASGNVPGGRNNAVSWIDQSGNFWLFGGNGYDSTGAFNVLNDLWEFVPSTNQWAWMSGSSIADQPGIYGTLGTAAAANVPGARVGAVSWTDTSGNFWLFGGSGLGAGATVGPLNDLWIFNPDFDQWTWMGGTGTKAGVAGVYGTLGTAAAGNFPGSRAQATSWTDIYGDLWLFGGDGYDSKGSLGSLNDLWEFVPSSGQWAWIAGSKTANGTGVYGTLDTPAAGNTPGARIASQTWVDFSGNLWLFGGSQYNDLWVFNTGYNEWTWMGGSTTVSAPGVYGTLGTPAAANMPGGRTWSTGWIDSSANLWLFGGSGLDAKGRLGWLNDLWEYNSTIGEWTWMGGTSALTCTTSSGTCPGPAGVYGTLGTAAAGNTPGGRNSAVSWTDFNGNLWVMGGEVYDANDNLGDLNDLWEYQLPSSSTPPTTITPVVTLTPSAASITTAQALTVQVTVAGGSGNPTPTGSVSLSSIINLTTNVYVSAATTLRGGSATIDVPAEALSTGSSTLVATYTPDSASSATYTTASGTATETVTDAYIPTGTKGFGTVAIGQTSAPVTLTFTFAGSGTIGSITALTQGSTGLDFAIATGGTCKTGTSFTSSSSCTVNATFAPKFAGLRNGAVVLEDSSSNTVASIEISGTGSGPQVRVLPGTTSVVGGGFNYPFGLAVDGNGDVFVADSGNSLVKEIRVGCVSATCVTRIGSGFNNPYGVAMDVYGNLVVADSGNELVKQLLAAGGYNTVNILGAPFQPAGVAVDSSDNVYVAANDAGDEIPAQGGYATYNPLGGGTQSTPSGPWDFAFAIAVDASGNVFTGDSDLDLSNGALSEIPAGCATATCIKTLSKDSSFYGGVTVDGSGNVIAADSGSNSVLEFKASGGFATIETLASTGLSDPNGIAVDGAGNVYVAQSNEVEKLDLADGALVTFPTATPAGSTDTTDGTQLITIENTGNAQMSLSGFTQPGANFTIDNSKTTCTPSSTLAAGASCTVGVKFTPTITGTVTGTTIFTDNTLNKTGATQTVTLIGNGVAPAGKTVPTMTVSASSQVITLTQALNVTATVNGGSGNPTPTGSVTLTSGSYTSAAATLSSGIGAISIPPGSLAAGTDTLTVSYTPDTASSSLYTNAAGTALVTVTAGQASAEEWTWIGGSDVIDGAIGAVVHRRPIAAGQNPLGSTGTPAAREEAASWTDSSGNLWLFGGEDLGTNGYPARLNDLWEYQPSANTWAMVSGSTSNNQPGVYGTLGTAAATNTPGGRENSSAWTDSSGKLWLFGGDGSDSAGTVGYLNDLWKFDPGSSEWTWIGGNSTIPSIGSGHAGEYGTQGTAAAGNIPGSRWAASSWVDASGNFWLFGGAGYDADGVNGTLNDLWEYSTSTGKWTWISGSSTVPGQYGAQSGVYGTLGTAAKANVPGGRLGASSWVDQSGHVWLLGGNGVDANGVTGELNDVWEFNPTTSEWTWMGGSSTVPSLDTGRPGVYGVLGSPASGNIPGGREYASTWTDGTGNLWLLGGYGFDDAGHNGDLNDLWEFNLSNNEWAWIAGSNSVPQSQGQSGIYGVMGAPSPANTPGGRQSASSWTDSSGHFWLFGGGGYDSVGNDGYLNDLWEYALPSNNTPAAATPTFSVAAGTYASAQSVTISDATTGATIYYSINGNAPTTSSTVFSAGTPIVVSSTETLKAIATASGYSTSAVASATYTITAATGATPTVSPGSNFPVNLAQAPVGAFVYVSGATGAPSPTGSVTLTSGSYTGTAALSSGAFPSASFVVPGGALPVGNDTLTATYTPDSASAGVYIPATGTSTVTIVASTTVGGEWTWEGGNSIFDTNLSYPAVYGTLGTPAAANTPGSRGEGATWTDAAGNFWLFGGNEFDFSHDVQYINDLWEYSPSSGEWTWMRGPDTTESPGVYGTLGTPATANTPGARGAMGSWTDKNGNIWLFGGLGYDSAGTEGYLNDLWELSASSKEWTWMGGSSTISAFAGIPGVYGTLGTPGAANIPGSRWGSAVWTDLSGNFWLFGGNGYDSTGANGELNDLWEFSTTTKQWTWMGGSNTVGSNGGQSGVYGTLGTPASGNIPGGRDSASGWTDSSGHLWLFGGNGAVGIGADLNDLWEFDIATGLWTWMGGSDTSESQGAYGTLGAPAAGNAPASRRSASSWTDKEGNFWIFGGYTIGGDLDDLWMLSPTTVQWTWMGGADINPGYPNGYPGIYGTEGQPAAANIPGSRYQVQTWTASDGSLWLFGGLGWPGFDTSHGGEFLSDLNDLWRFGATATTPAAATPTFSIPAGTYATAQSVAINDTTTGATIYYTTNGNAPTTSSTVYSAGPPVVVSSTETLKAMATASGYTNSVVASATYTITPAAKTTPTLGVTPSAASITTAQALTVTVGVSGGTGNPTPTGSVTLTSGSYTSASVTLTSGSATINIPAGSLATGSDTLTVSYTPDSASSSTYNSATGTGSVTVTAATVQVTVGTTPAGLSFTVDAASYTSTQILTWTVGSTHTIATTSPQTAGGIQNTFASWSDAGALSHSVTASSSTTSYTASFNTAYQLTTAVSPAASGTVSPASGSYHASGSQVTLTATPASAYTFSSWTGNVASTSSASTTITMSAAESVTANFSAVVPAPVVSLTPTSLSFSAVNGATSGAQTVTLSNTGNASLSISGIAITGTNSSNFSQTNTCGESLAAAASCTISVTFAPSSTASFSASLSITDNAAGSPQSVALSGTGTAAPSFTVSSSTAPQTIQAGGTATYTIAITPQNGAFTGVVTLAASGAPPGATVSFSPATVTPGSSAASSTLTIQAAQTTTSLSRSAWPLATSALALMSLFFLPGKRRGRWITYAVFVVGSLGAFTALSGCGGGFGSIQPSQTYTVTVTGTSGTTQQTTTVQITVQ